MSGTPVPPREVLGLDASIAVVGPDDKLVVKFPEGTDMGQIDAANHALKQCLGQGRYLLFAGDVEMSVIRG